MIGRQERETAPSTDLRSEKSVAAPTSLERFSLLLMYGQPGPFDERDFNERNASEVSYKNGGRKSVLSGRAGWLIAVCQLDLVISMLTGVAFPRLRGLWDNVRPFIPRRRWLFAFFGCFF